MSSKASILSNMLERNDETTPPELLLLSRHLRLPKAQRVLEIDWLLKLGASWVETLSMLCMNSESNRKRSFARPHMVLEMCCGVLPERTESRCGENKCRILL